MAGPCRRGSPALAATPQRRQAFVSSCIDTFIKGNLPGGSWPAERGRCRRGGRACSTASTSTGSIRPRSRPATSATAPPIGTTPRCWRPSSASSSTRTVPPTGKHYLLTAAMPAATSATKYYELAQFSHVPRLGQRHDVRLQRAWWLDRRRWTPCSATTRVTRTRATGRGTRPAPIANYLLQRRARHRRSWSACRSTATSTSAYRRRVEHGLYGTFDNTGRDPNSLQSESDAAADLSRPGRRSAVTGRRERQGRRTATRRTGTRPRVSRTWRARTRATRAWQPARSTDADRHRLLQLRRRSANVRSSSRRCTCAARWPGRSARTRTATR